MNIQIIDATEQMAGDLLAIYRFHEKMGYKIVGRFTNCAAKFGRLYSMVWMEKIISAAGD